MTTIAFGQPEKDSPSTGLLTGNHFPEWLYDELNRSIDLDYMEALESGDYDLEDLENWETQESTLLVGSWVLSNGLYYPDQTGEYAAVYRSGGSGGQTLQVVWSKTVKRFKAAAFQGCYPGQVLIDSGESRSKNSGFMAYCLPED